MLMGISVGLALRSNTWNKLSLKTTIDGKVIAVEQSDVSPGDKGISITRLNPMGKVLFNDKVFEGKSGHHFIDQNTPIELVKIERNQLIVKRIE